MKSTLLPSDFSILYPQNPLHLEYRLHGSDDPIKESFLLSLKDDLFIGICKRIFKLYNLYNCKNFEHFMLLVGLCKTFHFLHLSHNLDQLIFSSIHDFPDHLYTNLWSLSPNNFRSDKKTFRKTYSNPIFSTKISFP